MPLFQNKQKGMSHLTSKRSLKRRLRISNPFASAQSKASSAKDTAESHSVGGVFAASLHQLDIHKSQHSLDTHNTEQSDSTTSSTSSTWPPSGSPTHHKDTPLIVQRSPSLIGGPSAKQQSSRSLNVDQPTNLGQVMAKARLLPPDSNYIASNHVMINAERVNRLIQPLVRLPLRRSRHKPWQTGWNCSIPNRPSSWKPSKDLPIGWVRMCPAAAVSVPCILPC